MKAIVLCGGLGTRLGPLTADLPKPLVDVAGRPFIAYVLDRLVAGGVDGFVLAAGFRAQKIRDAIGEEWRGANVEYSIEAGPLGTGGAIAQAFARSGLSEAIVVNGDTLLDFDARLLDQFARERNADIGIALKPVPDAGRFGRVLTDGDGRVTRFEEKGASTAGLINAGFYHVQSRALARAASPAFSFEYDLLKAHSADMAIFGLPTDGYFIDMGIPEDLAKARADLSRSSIYRQHERS